MKKNFFDRLSVVVVTATGLQYFFPWIDVKGIPYLREIVYSRDARPYVYRLFVPMLTRALAWITHIDAIYCLMIVFALLSIGFYYSLKYLYRAFSQDDQRASLAAFIGCQLLFLIMYREPRVYDPATAMFFALALGLLARGKFQLYYLLFPLATLNRETAFLLSIFFAVYFLGRIPLRAYLLGLAYQGFVLISLRALVMAMFAAANGVPFLFRPAYVIGTYLGMPIPSLLFVGGLALVAWLALRKGKEKPLILRVAFITIFPAVIILHLLLGDPFEVRVLAEALPAATILATYFVGRTEQPREEKQSQIPQVQRSL